jgi:hypothetical protein
VRAAREAEKWRRRQQRQWNGRWSIQQSTETEYLDGRWQLQTEQVDLFPSPHRYQPTGTLTSGAIGQSRGWVAA